MADVDNLAELMYTQADINAITVNEKNVELYGLIVQVNAPETVGRVKKYEVMKFLLSNQNGIFIQCSIWGTDIALHRANITAGSIVHINGAWANDCEARWNQGTAPWELSIKSSTIIEVEQENMPIVPARPEAIRIELEDIGLHVEMFIEFSGFLKSPFQLVPGRAAYGTTTICTGQRVDDPDRCDKVDIRVTTYVPNEALEVGMHLRVRGTRRSKKDLYRRC